MSTQRGPTGSRGQSGRAGGARALMLLGVLLALLSGVLVIYIVSQATTSAEETVQVVVANQAISQGTTLSANTLPTLFTVESFPARLVPSGAYVFTTEDKFKLDFNDMVVVQDLVPGDVILAQDPRIEAAGNIVKGSIANMNPKLLPAGSILFAFNYSYPNNATISFFTAGDEVDVIVEECNAPFTTSGCVTQTTLQSIPIFATFQSAVILVLTPYQAKQLRLLASTGTIDLALRKPGDTTQDTSPAVTPATLANNFHF